MSSTFGDQPGDVVTSSRGDVLNGVSLSLYPTSADAVAGTNLLATVVTNTLGRWSYTHATLTVVWVRDPNGQVWSVEDPTAAGASEVAAAAADATSKVAAEAVLARIADNLTSGTVADARLPVTAQAATLIADFAPVAEPIGAAAQVTANNAVPKAVARIRSAVLMNGTTQSATLNAEIASLSTFGGGTIELPGSNLPITCNTSITLADGVTLAGAGMSPTSGGPSRFDFSALATGQSPFVITNGSDIALRDFYIKGWAAGGAGSIIAVAGASRRITVERVTINAVTTGAGISFGLTGSVITSSIEGCVVVGCGYGVYIGAACTSINVDNCYANANTITGYQVYGTYVTLSACGADGNTLYGYVFQNAVGVAALSCGAENSGRTGFFLTGAKGVTLVSCRTVNSNTSAGATYPSFIDLSNSADYVTLIGCTDTTPNAATTYSVSTTAGTAGLNFSTINCGGLFVTKPSYVNIISRTAVSASSAAGGAGLNVPHGVAPTTPVNGDMWTTTAGLYVRINGATVGPLT